MKRYLGLAAFAAAALTLLLLDATSSAGGKKAVGPSAKEWDEAVNKAVAFLKGRQADDGSWSKQSSPGVTAIVVRALVQSGKMSVKDPGIDKALTFVANMAHPEDGHLAGKGGKTPRQVNYFTSANLMALAEADPKKYAAIITKATEFLKGQSLNEKRGKDKKDASFGGFGYDATTRGDMSNTVLVLEALHAAKVPADDPVFKNALVFVSRSQNFKGEDNDQPWAGKINDGSFIYVTGPAGAKKGAAADAPRPGYGSMTTAGLVSLDICGVKKTDPRYQKALEWMTKDFSVEKNLGSDEALKGYYYYLMMLSTALARNGQDKVTDAKKVEHDWRAEVTAALRKRQREDGGWANTVGTWMEANPDLATAWALTALSNSKPKE